MRYKIILKNKKPINNKIIDHINKILNDNNWKYEEKNFDYLFIIAGDGTFINSINTVFKNNNNVKYVLINDSHIGYYYDFKKEDLDVLLNNIISNKANIVELPLLEIHFLETKEVYYALNEIKLINYINPIKMECKINDIFLKNIKSSGIVVSTSNGSSGFTNSINGAIMIPMNLMQFKEIAPVINFENNFFGSSFILNNNNSIELKLEKNNFLVITDNLKLNNIQNLKFLIKISDKTVLKLGNKNNLDYRINRLNKIFINNK